MAKKNQIDQEASDAIYYIQKEAELRKEISSSFDSYIENVDFYVSIDEVAKLVQPMTDLLLKDL